jgi:hypothetical protein
MNSKVVLSVFGGVFIVAVSIFLVVNLIDSCNGVKEMEDKNTETVQNTADKLEEASEDLQENVTTLIDTTPQIDYEDAIPFGVIQVPVICGHKERLDPRKNICKRVI